MCFGSKPKVEDDNSNADNLNSRPVDSKTPEKTSSTMPPSSTSNYGYAPPSGPPRQHQNQQSYAPPSGPPPSHQTQETYAPPSGPPPSQSHNDYSPPAGPPPSHARDQYAPPSGPPPSHSHNEFSPPAGPPPAHSRDEYAPPSGPPPSHSNSDYTSPPPGPPPSHSKDEYAPPPGPPPPQHDWQTAVPDTSLLPPPPSLGNERSTTTNATEQEAEQGEAWCQQNPMTGPTTLPQEVLDALDRGEIGVVNPRGYQGQLDPSRPAGVWAVKSKAKSPDTCISSSLPLYSVNGHSPLKIGKSKTIYYEARVSRKNRSEVNLAIGYTAGPYPTFRQPGWHRGSLAVHGDDGSKFINDRWGGKDFTTPFKPGETVGLGMTFTARDVSAPPSYSGQQPTVATPIDVEIFFTRNGRKDGGWNLHEEGDSVEDLPVDGLEGFNDMYAAIGTYHDVEFEIIFNPGEWMYRP